MRIPSVFLSVLCAWNLAFAGDQAAAGPKMLSVAEISSGMISVLQKQSFTEKDIKAYLEGIGFCYYGEKYANFIILMNDGMQQQYTLGTRKVYLAQMIPALAPIVYAQLLEQEAVKKEKEKKGWWRTK